MITEFSRDGRYQRRAHSPMLPLLFGLGLSGSGVYLALAHQPRVGFGWIMLVFGLVVTRAAWRAAGRMDFRR